jgi:hypothetical protein
MIPQHLLSGVLDGTIRQRDARASGVANQCSKGHAVGEVR